MNCPACGVLTAEGARFCSNCGSPLAPVCPSCGAEIAAGARFCASCGTSLRSEDPSPPRSEVESGEELKVISVLFCDLVGFTSHTEQTDPEDVRERLTVYHSRVRADVERFGGRVEKLMGDGVFAVFGSPAVHEDDPERAVRAALRITESLAEANAGDSDLALAARIAVTTGEAILQTTDVPDRERIIGDVVNTASRLQQVAPVGGVVVDQRTFQVLRDAVEFESLDPVQVKGKVEPIPIWRAVAVRSRQGVAVDAAASDVFVGRSHELSLLTDALQRTEGLRGAQLVTIVGEPGVGKSRLVHELYRWSDDRSELVWWRQGRCLPYGEGITFWALGEIVKSHAGILEAEPPAQVAAKLAQTVTALVDDPTEAEWVRSRLAPLAGLTVGNADRTELFAAWHRFFEALALRHPLVMVIEDLHWADQAVFDFLDHLLDWSRDLPILLVCTARPELLTDHPEWGAGRRDAVTIGLSALAPEATIELVRALSRRTVMPADAQRALLERSGGNPLYVTEYVRLAAERGLLDRLGEADLPLPDTIQALISARLDLLAGEDKALLQAAAVVGKVFWTGAVAFLRGIDVDAVREGLRRMTQRELIRPVRRSSMLGQDEHAFVHVLARDVAYSQIPRRERAALHLAAGRWLEAKAEDRLVDVAEQLAYHYSTALELAAAPDDDVRARSHRFLVLAAERAAHLDATRAAEYYRHALGVSVSDAERGLALLGMSRHTFDDVEESLRLVREAEEAFTAADDFEGRVRALDLRGSTEWYRGNAETSGRVSDEILELVEGRPASQAVAEALVGAAARFQLAGREAEALDAVERGIAASQEIGSTETYARGLVIRGSTLTQMGDLEAESEVAEGLRIFLDRNETQRAMAAYNNHATFLIAIGELEQGKATIDEAIAYGAARGLPAHVDWSRMTRCEALFPLGEWDEIVRSTEALIEADDARGGSQVGTFARGWQAVVAYWRGQSERAMRLWEPAMRDADEIEDPQAVFPALAIGVPICEAVGDRGRATSLAHRLADACRLHPIFGATHLPMAAASMRALAMVDVLEDAIEAVHTTTAPFIRAQGDRMRAIVAEERGDHGAALNGYRRLRQVGDGLSQRFWTTVARIDGARCAVALGEDGEAARLLDRARSDAGWMGAGRLIDAIAALEEGREAANR